jgi:hypothetical protein
VPGDTLPPSGGPTSLIGDTGFIRLFYFFYLNNKLVKNEKQAKLKKTKLNLKQQNLNENNAKLKQT